jgi:hypothetical protein
MKFEIRLQTAIKVATETLGTGRSWSSESRTIEAWYDLRSRISHGETASAVVDVVDH